MSKKVNRSRYKRPRNYFMIDHRIYQLPAYLNLSHMAAHLLFDMCYLYNGFNNGDISIAFSDMKPRGWSSAGSIDKAKNELLASGLIYLTRAGNRYGDCALYALSWVPLDECNNKLLPTVKTGEVILDLAKQ